MTTVVGRRGDLELAHAVRLSSPLAAIFVLLRPPDLRENDWLSALSGPNRNNHLNLRNSRRRIDLTLFSQKLPFFSMLQLIWYFSRIKSFFTTPFHDKFIDWPLQTPKLVDFDLYFLSRLNI